MGGHELSGANRFSIRGECPVKNIKILAVIFSVALNIAFLVSYGVRKLGERPKFVYEELELTKDQLKQIQSTRPHFLGAIDEIGDKILNRQVELIDLVAADPVDRQAIESKFQQMRELQESMQQRVVEHLLGNKQLLNPAQRAKFFAVLKSRIQKQGAPGPPWMPAGARSRK
jgi:Spy/CpxP family protein refolding chaperone